MLGCLSSLFYLCVRVFLFSNDRSCVCVCVYASWRVEFSVLPVQSPLLV
jgi:hypothetical protein